PAHGGIAIGGRFGVQGWAAGGVRDTSCSGETSSMVVAWPERRVVTSGDCDLATGQSVRSTRVPFEVSDDGRFVVASDGTFLDRASGRRVQLEGQSE
ncbi:hypothetical protein ITH51_24130, partial [Salmonella enterica subsp. enterica serovar Weltevreden]